MNLKNLKISIIIPFYGNQNQCVINAVESLYSSNLKNLNIILIDNGSTTKVSSLLIKLFPKVKIIKSKINTGVTGGRNLGIDNLNGNEDFVIFFDSDQVVHKNMIEELIKPFYKDLSIGITTPKIYYHPDFLNSGKVSNIKVDFKDLNKNSSNIVWAAGTDINMTTGQILFKGGIDNSAFDKDYYVNVAPAVLCCKYKLIKDVGYFDNIYFATYEDTDYCFRALNLGYKIYYCSKAWAWHEIYYDPKGSEQKLLTRLYFVGRNRLIFMKRFAKNYYLFLFFVPVYLVYYTYICLKNLNLKALYNFYKGTIHGIFFYK